MTRPRNCAAKLNGAANHASKLTFDFSNNATSLLIRNRVGSPQNGMLLIVRPRIVVNKNDLLLGGSVSTD